MKHLVQGIPVLKKWVATRHLADREKAKKFWGKGKREEAYKILQHMIMAECILHALEEKMKEAGGSLHRVTLSMAELQDITRGGRDENDRKWIGLLWSEVETCHNTRLLAIR